MSWYIVLKNFGITLKDFFWFMDSRVRQKLSAQEYLKRNCAITINLINDKKLPYFKDKLTDQRECIRTIYQWVCDNIRYRSDSLNFSRPEMWEDVDILLENRSGDCESMSLLIYCMARAHRINPLELHYVVGKVKEGGHAWLQWFDIDKNKWYIIDAAYAPNLKRFHTVDGDSRYIERWHETTVI